MSTSVLVVGGIAIGLVAYFSSRRSIRKKTGLQSKEFRLREVPQENRQLKKPQGAQRRTKPRSTQKSSGTLTALKEIVVIDFETTGLDPSDHRIVSAAAVSANIRDLIDNRGQSVQYWQARFNPERRIPVAASRIHGIYDRDVKDEDPFRNHAKGLLDFIGSRTIVAHNADFDVAFLKAELKRCGLPFPSVDIFCTMKSGAKMLGRSRVSLEVLARELNVGGRSSTRHDALEDAILTLKVATALAVARDGHSVSRMDVD